MIIQPHNIDKVLSAANPVLIHMLGIPGAGKSTFLEILRKKWNSASPAYLLGFDQIMTDIAAYQAIADKDAAFAKYELPARETGYRLLDNLMIKRANILFDNGGSAAHHLDLLQHAKNVGYYVVLVSITAPLNTAQQRIDARAALEARTTPPHYLSERHEKLAALEMQYRRLTPAFYHLHNDGCDRTVFVKTSIELADKLLHDLAMVFYPVQQESGAA